MSCLYTILLLSDYYCGIIILSFISYKFFWFLLNYKIFIYNFLYSVLVKGKTNSFSKSIFQSISASNAEAALATVAVAYLQALAASRAARGRMGHGGRRLVGGGWDKWLKNIVAHLFAAYENIFLNTLSHFLHAACSFSQLLFAARFKRRVPLAQLQFGPQSAQFKAFTSAICLRRQSRRPQSQSLSQSPSLSQSHPTPDPVEFTYI